MPDEMDAVQERVLAANAAAVDRARAAMGGVGASECACGEPISIQRQRMGAVRYLDCQREFEALTGRQA